jgi:two-component system C4-dicarboxylate transport sensor histidine kinase DctB
LSGAGVLAAAVAHEILNPATAARFLCDRALSDAKRGAPAHTLLEPLAGIHEGIEQIIAVASELRAFASRRGRSREVVDLGDIVASVLTLAGAQLGNDARIRVELRAAPEVFGDAIALRQLVLNLLQNAARAVAGQQRAWVRVVVDRTEDGSARLDVHDDGPGFSAQLLGSAFFPFQSGTDGGSGLGLYVCKRIVDEHSGSIELDNRPEGGAVVRVTLPAFTSESA